MQPIDVCGVPLWICEVVYIFLFPYLNFSIISSICAGISEAEMAPRRKLMPCFHFSMNLGGTGQNDQ